MVHSTLLVFIFALLAAASADSAQLVQFISGNSSRQILPSVFSCDSSDPLLQAICKEALKKINAELQSGGISIDRAGLLFNYDDPKDEKIRTGHSCTVTADVKHKRVTARIDRSAGVNLSGNSLTEPLTLRFKLPVTVDARVDVKQRFGTRLIFGCSNYASDSYSLKATLSTQADAVIGFALNPSLGKVASGDYGLVLEPNVAVLSSLDNFDLDFRVSGVSPITSVLTHIVGFSSTILKSITALFKGDSVSKIIKDSLVFDFGVPIVLGIGALPRPVEDLIWGQLANFAEHIIEKEALGFGADLEDKLNADVRRIFKTDDDGKRTIIVKKEIVQLVAGGAGSSQIFIDPPRKRSLKACKDPVLRLCAQCRGCPDCVNRLRACDKAEREYNRQYGATNLVASKPKIASLPPVSTAPPTTTTTTTTRTRTFTNPCEAPPGQEPSCLPFAK